MNVQLRSMQYADITAVMEIETIAYPFPWTQQNFEDCLRTGYNAEVLQLYGDIVGYGIMSIAADEAQILNLCVHPNMQQCGYGHQILSQLLEYSKQKCAKSVFLEVRTSNKAAINLYYKTGFNQVGLRKNYYLNAENGREDALILALEIMIKNE